MDISGLSSYSSALLALQQMQSTTSTTPKAPSFDDLLSNLDTNGDDGLSIDEVNISEEAFAKADANSDGIIDETEYDAGGDEIIGDDLRAQGGPPPMGSGPQPGSEPSFSEVLSQWDTNGDGTLSIDELGASEEAFGQADTNEDGVIDESEFDSGGNKIIGDDLRAQGGPPPMGPPPESSSTTATTDSSSSSLTGSSLYEYLLQSMYQNSSSTTDDSSLTSLLSSINVMA